MSRDVLASTLSDLRTAFDRLAEEIWGDLLIQSSERDTGTGCDRRQRSFLAKRLEMEDALDRVSTELASTLRSLASGPRLTESFASIAIAPGIQGAESSTPDHILQAVLRSISAGAVTFVGRDIFIGTNVAAMGPFGTPPIRTPRHRASCGSGPSPR